MLEPQIFIRVKNRKLVKTGDEIMKFECVCCTAMKLDEDRLRGLPWLTQGDAMDEELEGWIDE